MPKQHLIFDGKFYPCKVWQPIDGNIGAFAYDSETTMIEPGTIPDFIIGAAYNGKTVFFVTRERLAEFFARQHDTRMYLANAAFDIPVAEKLCGPLHRLFDEETIVDILLLKQLVNIATQGTHRPIPSLDRLALEYIGVELPKDVKSSDGQEIRTTFSRFLNRDMTVEYEDMPFEYLQYVGADAIATYFVAQKLLTEASELSRQHGVDETKLLSQALQAKAAYALSYVSNHGMSVDLERVDKETSALNAGNEELRQTLVKLGWTDPGDGISNELRAILEQLDTENNLDLSRTPTGKISASVDALEKHLRIPFIEAWLRYAKNKKILQFLKYDKPRIHPRFGALVSTGRTSSSNPNFQNLPRDSRVRSVFVPAPGYVFLDVDYSQIELRTLSQLTYRKYGASRMRDLLNDGVDLHKFFAAKITGKGIEEITKDERSKAKACNFGFPGGLGLKSFMNYAAANYKQFFDETEAGALKDSWLDTFPEIKEYLAFDEMELLKNSGLLSSCGDYPGSGGESAGLWAFRRIISGEQTTKTWQREYSFDEIEWAFQIIENVEFPGKERFEKAIAKRRGLPSLWKNFALSLCHLVFDSGRVQANVGYADSKNNPFQGLAADGAKEGLYDLIKAGYRVVNFIHDEYLIEVPVDADLKFVQSDVESRLITAMSKYCPDVRIEVESAWMDCWQKDVSLTLSDDGRLLPRAVK